MSKNPDLNETSCDSVIIVNSPRDQRAIPLFLLLTFGLSSIFYFLAIKGGLGGGGGAYVLGLMWCPGTAALLTSKLLQRDVAGLGWKWKAPYQVASYLIPLAYATIAYVIVWLTGLGGFYNSKFVARVASSYGLGPLPDWAAITLYFFFSATTGVIRGCASALGEEIGWRGFLVPELFKRFNFTTTALISGCIWAVWHYPLLIFGNYNGGTPTWYSLLCFTVMVIAIAFVFAWMRLKSGSLWTGVLLHASHNLFIQAFFDPITTDTGRTRYIIGEFGAALPIVTLIFAIYFWTRRREVSSQTSGAAA